MSKKFQKLEVYITSFHSRFSSSIVSKTGWFSAYKRWQDIVQDEDGHALQTSTVKSRFTNGKWQTAQISIAEFLYKPSFTFQRTVRFARSIGQYRNSDMSPMKQPNGQKHLAFIYKEKSATINLQICILLFQKHSSIRVV